MQTLALKMMRFKRKTSWTGWRN